MVNTKKENLKTLSEEAIDTLINCFQSHEYIWNVARYVRYVNLICQCKNITSIDMTIKEWNILRDQFSLFL